MRDLVAVIKLAFIPQSAVTLSTLHFIDRTDNYSAVLTGPSVTAALQLLGSPAPVLGLEAEQRHREHLPHPATWVSPWCGLQSLNVSCLPDLRQQRHGHTGGPQSSRTAEQPANQHKEGTPGEDSAWEAQFCALPKSFLKVLGKLMKQFAWQYHGVAPGAPVSGAHCACACPAPGTRRPSPTRHLSTAQ